VSIDLNAAISFMARHARVLDRRRLEMVLGAGSPAPVFAALDGYRNPDGGYGWGLEADLRSPESQPGGALHAFEAMADAATYPTPRAVELCDWLAGVSLGDGGLPFALPVRDPAGVAPFFAGADADASSLQITAYVAAAAQQVALYDAAVAEHPWLAGATRYCLGAIEALEDAPFALVLTASLLFLDAVHDTHPEAPGALARLGRFIPPSGLLPVAGGAADEMIRPLDYAPSPDRPVRRLLDPSVVASELERLIAEQQPDGGWQVDFQSYSPAATLEWRGYKTVQAVSILRQNGLL
jgi:hypothetical protein